MAYVVYKYCYNQRKKDDELSYYASLHIATIIWNKYHKKVKKYLDKLKDKLLKVDFKKEYKLSYEILNNLVKQNKKDDIVSVGHYISRLEFENLLNASI